MDTKKYQEMKKETFRTKNVWRSVKHEGSLISVCGCLQVSGTSNLAIIVKIIIYHVCLNIMKGSQYQRAFVLLHGRHYIFQQDNGSKYTARVALWYDAQK